MAERYSTRTTRERHGERLARTPEYAAWQHMTQRCYDPRCKDYPRWGGRGITVCERWRSSYLAFLADVGRKPTPQHTLDRTDNDGAYCPENCRWQTRKQQANNTRRNRLLTHDGLTLPLADWSARTGIHYVTLYTRLRNGWSVADALTRPVRRW